MSETFILSRQIMMEKLITIFFSLTISTILTVRSQEANNTDLHKLLDIFNHNEGYNLKCIKEPLECIPKKTNYYNGALQTGISSKNLVEINELLQKWNINTDKQVKNTTNKILVIGNSGVGVSTFVHFIAGNNTRMIAEEAGIATEEYIITDGNKIGSSDTESFTIYPEELNLDEKTSITDIPGFNNFRKLEEEIIVLYNIDNYLQNIHHASIRIVLLIEYYSVKQGINMRNFINFLKNMHDRFENINYYRSRTTLIVTKVPNKYRITSMNRRLIPNKNIIINIAQFITKIKASLEDNLEKVICKEKEFYKFAVDIMNVLLQTDKDGNYKNINIFRQPEEPGVLLDIQTVQDNKKSLLETILDSDTFYSSSSYISIKPSERFKKFKNCAEIAVNRNILNAYKNIERLTIKHTLSDEECYRFHFSSTHNEINELNEEVNELYKLKRRLQDGNNRC